MNREARHHFDVLGIGGGPAGMAAAACAAECGVRVGMVDDNPSIGGQIWRGESDGQHNTDASKWVQRVRRSGTASPVQFVKGPACLLAASISVEAVTPPLVGWPIKNHFQTRLPKNGSQFIR